MKITKSQLRDIIREEAQNFIGLKKLQERKAIIEAEIKLLEEGSMEDFMGSTKTSNKYDLSDENVREQFFNDLISVWTKYCGQNPNSSAIANDNRVILYNMLNDGTIQTKINQIWSPSSLNLGSHGREYPTNNPELMSNHLENIGITNFELKELK